MRRIATILLGILAVGVPLAAHAQGVLIVVDPNRPVRLPRPVVVYYHHVHPPVVIPAPQPEPTYKISEIDVNARLIDQVARVQVSQSFVNTGSRQLEVSFVFPLPYDGAVEEMTLLVDGKEYPARLLGAEEARRTYEDIVRRNRDPALLEWMGTGMFKTSVFPVPPGAKRTVTLRYSQLLRKQEGLTDFLFPLSTAKYTSHPIEKVSLRATIESKDAIKNVYSPTHDVAVQRPDDTHATITYERSQIVPSSDFRLLYDVGQEKVSTRVLSYRPQKDDQGFFLLLASPKIEQPKDEEVKKTVMVVLDRSGSMSGEKMDQAREAARFVVNHLRENDLFNVIAYDSQVEAFRPELQRFTDETRKQALGFIESIYAGGSTNIHGALETTLNQLHDTGRPTYILFLTDGIPTAGETSEPKIVDHVREKNRFGARIFTFGVGYDLNSRLLDKLARETFGQSEYVRPSEDIEDRVSRLYRRIEAPVMTDLKIAFELDEARVEEGEVVNRVYPKGRIDLFAGEQLVLVGRYKRPGAAKVVVRGMVGGQEQKFDFPAKFVKRSDDESLAFVEKLWAVRRVGEILDEIDLHGKNSELVQELVSLSTRHGIITPYTSFLADENARVDDLAANAARAGERLEALAFSEGEIGVRQRALKNAMQQSAQTPGMEFYADRSFSLQGNVARSAAPMPSSAGSGMGMPGMAGRRYGGGGGYGGVFGGPAAEAPAGAAVAADEKAEVAQAAETVRNIANRAFYRRNGQWVDSTLTPSQQQQQQTARRIKQFSDEYFELAKTHGRELSQYLVFDEPVLLNVDNEPLLIEP